MFFCKYGEFLRLIFYRTPLVAAFEIFYLHVLIFLSENKIKETSNNNQIYSFFWNVFLLNVDIWLYNITNASIYDISNRDC